MRTNKELHCEQFEPGTLSTKFGHLSFESRYRIDFQPRQIKSNPSETDFS